MENEIKNFENVNEVVSEEFYDDSGNFGVVVVGLGLTALAGVALYKYIIKPTIAKIKEKKAKKEGVDSSTVDEFEEDLED